MINKTEVINLITKNYQVPKSLSKIYGNDIQATVIASEINGLSLLNSIKVYSALKEELASEAIHALALKNGNTKLNYGQLNKDKTQKLIESNPVMVFRKELN